MWKNVIYVRRLKVWILGGLLLIVGWGVSESFRAARQPMADLGVSPEPAGTGEQFVNGQSSSPAGLESRQHKNASNTDQPLVTDPTHGAGAEAQQEQHGHESKFGNFDRRRVRERTESPEQRAALEGLRARVPGVDVQFDAVTGAANHIMAVGQFLTGPAPVGGGRYETLKRFVDENASLFGHTGDALAHGVRVLREDVSAHNGMRSVVWQQEVDGVPLYKTILRANLTETGEVVSIGSHFVRDAKSATQLAPEERARYVQKPPLSFAKAVALAADSVGVEVDENAVRGMSQPEGAERLQSVEAPGLSDVSAGLAWLPLGESQLTLGWDIVLMSVRQKEMFRLLVDATSGEVLVRTSLTSDLSPASYRVHANRTTMKPLDSPRPFSPGPASPNTGQPPEVERSLITLPFLDALASPVGWIADGGTQTYGNNVDAHLDLSGINPAWGEGTHAVSRTRVFDFPMVLSQSADTYRDAAVTTLFYLCNWYHDRLYSLGFTESAGNFQQNNFGRGGFGNDAVLADAQDGGGTNNANFSTPPDGWPGRMQMYLFSRTNPGRDASLDADVVFHEYTHGLSNRLVGGGMGISALQSAGLGEGWSDFYALSLLSEAGDATNGNYAAGGYVTGDYYRGVRHYPYTTDMSKNPLTLKFVDRSNGGSSEVHYTGEIWCVTLWEVRANLILKYGWQRGNELMLRLVTDGMKLSPVDPTFLQARDAILQADLVNNLGANRMELWRGFAKRGMGASAVVPVSSTTTGVSEAFDLPGFASVSPTSALTFERRTPGVVSPGARVVRLANTNASESITWTVRASEAWISVSPAGGVLAPGASVSVSVAVPAGAIPTAGGAYRGKLTFCNVVSGAEISREVNLMVGNMDFYTQLFDTSRNDTALQSWTFTPDQSPNFYAVKHGLVTWFPSSPLGGRAITFKDSGSVQVSLSGGKQVKLYGSSYSSLHVGGNGCVTLGEGDSERFVSLVNHFSKPRIAALWNNLDPSLGGSVSWVQWPDRIAVTYINVPLHANAWAVNSFQIELFFDGRIRITCLNVSAPDGLIGLSRGTGIPAFFADSDFSAYGFPASAKNVLTLSVPRMITEGAVGAQGSVSVGSIQASDLVVSLASSLPTKVRVRQSVTIPAGSTSAPFDLNVIDDKLLDGAQTLVVTGSANGFAMAAGVVLLKDNEADPGVRLSIPGSIVEGSTRVRGTVSLKAPAASAVSVSLISSAPAELRLPPVVVLPPGETSATFPVVCPDDHRLNGTRFVSVVAHVEGWKDDSVRVSVVDNENRNLTLFLPSSLGEGLTATGSVCVSASLSKPLKVALVSSKTSRLRVPASVTIPANSTCVSFALSAPNNALLDGAVRVNVAATAQEFTGVNRAVMILDEDVHHFTIAPVGASQIQGAPFVVSVTAKDVNDSTVSARVGQSHSFAVVAKLQEGASGPAHKPGMTHEPDAPKANLSQRERPEQPRLTDLSLSAGLRQQNLLGWYDGLLIPEPRTKEAADYAGLCGLNVGRGGAFSAKVILEGTHAAVPLHGYFDGAGVAQFRKLGSSGYTPSTDIIRAGFGTLALSMRAGSEPPLTQRVEGEVRSGVVLVASFTLNPRLNTGRPDMDCHDYIMGEFADGHRFACRNYLSKDDALGFFVPLYRGTGTLGGMVHFRKFSLRSDAGGIDLSWFKERCAEDALYPQGAPPWARVHLFGHNDNEGK